MPNVDRRVPKSLDAFTMTDDTRCSPDYSKFSLPELEDAWRWIDPDAYPDRAAALKTELETRRRLALYKERMGLIEPDFARPFLRSLKVLGIFTVVTSVVSMVLILNGLLKNQSPPTWTQLVYILALYAPLLVSGILLLRKSPGRLWVALIAWAIQIPVIQVHRLRYMFFSFPGIEVRLWPNIAFDSSRNVKFQVAWFDEPTTLYLGINIVAATVTGFLIERLERYNALKLAGTIHKRNEDAG